jgi:hypothetical protein
VTRIWLPVIICISASGTPAISRIWPMPIVAGPLPLVGVNTMTICPAVVTTPCMFVSEKLSNEPTLRVASLTPVNLP